MVQSLVYLSVMFQGDIERMCTLLVLTESSIDAKILWVDEAVELLSTC